MKEEKAMLLYEALTTEQFKQTGGRLRRCDGSMCIMGVACELSRVGKWEASDSEWADVRDLHYEVEGAFDHMSSTIPPSKVQEYFDFFDQAGRRRDGKPLMINGKQYEDLMDANDLGVPFHEIAMYIKENWEQL